MAERLKPSPNEHMLALGGRIRSGLAKKGWTQTQLELTAGFAQGSLSRIMAGRQQKVLPKTLHRIARALDMRPEDLAEGVALADDGRMLPSDVGPMLSELPGYADAELLVGRLVPHVPVEVFHEARKTRLASPPDVVSVDFLKAHVDFLAEHVFHVREASGTRVKRSERRTSSGTGRRRSGG
jgi:DNA-binding Xre family transcriptional regulator